MIERTRNPFPIDLKAIIITGPQNKRVLSSPFFKFRFFFVFQAFFLVLFKINKKNILSRGEVHWMGAQRSVSCTPLLPNGTMCDGKRLVLKGPCRAQIEPLTGSFHERNLQILIQLRQLGQYSLVFRRELCMLITKLFFFSCSTSATKRFATNSIQNESA